MFFDIRNTLARKRRSGSHLALAIALTTGAVVAGAGFAEPAHAQKKKKQDEPKSDYSKAFIEAYTPFSQLSGSEAPDTAAMAAMLPAIKAAAQTADDRHAAGSAVLQVGQKTKDSALQYEGLEMMIASGKVSADLAPQYNFFAGQLAYVAEDYVKARHYIQAAYDLGYRENDPQLIIAQSYFAEDNHAEGLKFLSSAIAAREAAGETVDEAWIKAGIAAAYNNNLKTEALDYARKYVTLYPSQTSWGDAVAIVLNTDNFEYPEILDLMRLARRADALRDAQLYKEYLEAADPRRLPGEVVSVIDEGYASGKLDRSDMLITDWYKLAKERSAADLAELPSYAADARKGNATVKTVVAAGDAYLNYGKPAEAEEFYSKAVTMPGANTPLVLTRLGIAQLDQGKYAEAQATFQRVEGARQAISNLYSVYATQQASR